MNSSDIVVKKILKSLTHKRNNKKTTISMPRMKRNFFILILCHHALCSCDQHPQISKSSSHHQAVPTIQQHNSRHNHQHNLQLISPKQQCRKHHNPLQYYPPRPLHRCQLPWHKGQRPLSQDNGTQKFGCSVLRARATGACLLGCFQ